ncbi:hypothetical protein H1C71_041837 [Ictidomys tridecemlineatus]|nr:hypothetical protein H1C71_041837 [Ictidomys tridecemlineatus]
MSTRTKGLNPDPKSTPPRPRTSGWTEASWPMLAPSTLTAVPSPLGPGPGGRSAVSLAAPLSSPSLRDAVLVRLLWILLSPFYVELFEFPGGVDSCVPSDVDTFHCLFNVLKFPI